MLLSITKKVQKHGPLCLTTCARTSVSEKLRRLVAEWKDCRLCRFSQYRNNMVWMKGAADSGIVFIGEAPGKKEDKQGVPFVGDAGIILHKAMKRIHCSLKDVCIVNVMACRPCVCRDGANDTPTEKEVRHCLDRLQDLLNILKPSVVVLLGRTAEKAVLGECASFPRLRFRGVLICSSLHPAALIYNMEERQREWENFWRNFKPLVRKHRGKRKKVVWKLPLKRKRG